MAQVSLAHGKVGSVSTTKLDDGRWRARARVGYLDNGWLTSFQVSRTTKSRKDAIAAIPEAVRKALAAKRDAARGVSVPNTMRALLVEWRDGLDMAGIHERTKQDYRYAADAILGVPATAKHGQRKARSDAPAAKAFRKIVDLSPTDVTEGHMKAFLLAVADGSGPAAAERARTVLRNVFHRAKDFGLTTVNPAVGLTYRKSDQDDYRTRAKKDDGLDHGRAPTDVEVRDLLTALREDPRAGRQIGPRTRSRKGSKYANPQDITDLTWFLFSVGCRLGEALALRWCDVNLGRSAISVRVRRTSWDTRQPETATITVPPKHASINATLNSIIGQGLFRGITKSPAGCRVVPLSPSAVAMLKARAAALEVPLRSKPERPIFGALTEPAKFREPSVVTAAIRYLYDEHGSTWHRSHGARKYVTTKLHRMGYDDNRIMRYMGWGDSATLAKYLDRRQDLPEEMGDALDLDAPLAIATASTSR